MMDSTKPSPRKRKSSEMSDSRIEAPKVKKRKRATKPKATEVVPTVSSGELPTPQDQTETVTTTTTTTSHKPKASPKKLPPKSSPKENGIEKSSGGPTTQGATASTSRAKGRKVVSKETDASTQAHASKSAGTSTEPTPHVRAKKRGFYLKPVHSSWMTHVASFVVHRCVCQAQSRDVDPRLHLNDINWSLLTGNLLSPDNLKMIWFYITKEYPDTALADISEALKPYSSLSMEQFIREDIKQKYKDQIPKPPLSAFMLFNKSKGPKLKEKHPELAQREMAVKLGKKWRTMGGEKKGKYQDQYTALKQDYSEKLKQFYDDHPDAKPPPTQRARSKGKASPKELNLTPEEKRLKELKAEMPRALPTPYFLFCKAKREKVHRKHPELSSKDVTIKLAKKWNSMGPEKQGKYKKAYEDSMHVYRQQMEVFHKRNPDAKELLARSRRKNKPPATTTTSNTSTQTSQPISPYDSSPPLLLLTRHEDKESPLLPHSEEEEEEEDEAEEGQGGADSDSDSDSGAEVQVDDISRDSSSSDSI